MTHFDHQLFRWIQNEGILKYVTVFQQYWENLELAKVKNMAFMLRQIIQWSQNITFRPHKLEVKELLTHFGPVLHCHLI